MRVSIPAGIAIGLAALFSVYHVVLGLTTLPRVLEVGPIVACMVLYVAATGVALFVPGRVLPVWATSFSLATAIVMPLIAAPAVELDTKDTYQTWWIAAVGTLMVVLVVRGRGAFAWIGVGFLFVHTVAWAGLGALGSLGVVGSVSWVAIAAGFTAAMNRATRSRATSSVPSRRPRTGRRHRTPTCSSGSSA